MTITEAINIISPAAYGHAFTTGRTWYQALNLAVIALVQQRDRQEGPPL